ncbi:type IX secretion system membrane protein PorP/SprF [uncultured Draconibacterium sp.]|uniref:PorP/SprF family type IX secretion system membrane protein n=1 Tax=uncultured Draconibacterium sp. TaxID=1573823 RepID=UPI003261C576
MGRFVKIAAYINLLFVILLQSSNASAQQDPMYTQYMDNLLVINPGFAGSKDVGNALLVARSQWVAFDGAPSTRSFAYNSSIEDKNVGFGFSVLSDKIGPLSQTGVYADYSYFIRVTEDFKLGLGLKGGVSFYRASLTDLATIDPDPIFDNDIYENFLPNGGIGMFLFSDDTYFGLSVPRLIENKITRQDVTTDYINTQQMHIYFVAGHKLELNEDIQLKGNGMLKYVAGAPVSVDLTVMGGFRNKFWVGAMYRFDAAYGIITQFKPTPKMAIGYSYDITITELNAFSNGTHEIMFSYDFDLFNRRSATAQK